MKKNMNRSIYLNKNEGDYQDDMNFLNNSYEKVYNLRYGTNPHQTAAYYKLKGKDNTLGDLKILKNGKNGLSQTNLEDISYALNIAKFFQKNAICIIMKHVNPCGVALGNSTQEAFSKAWDVDPRAAFGSTICFNTKVDEDTAQLIMSNFIECVIAPDFSKKAIEILNNFEKYKKNRHIRLLQYKNISALPKFVGEDKSYHSTIKVLVDGSAIIAQPLLTHLKSINDMVKAQASSKKIGSIRSIIKPTPQQLNDMMTAWYINFSLRSNGIVIVKNGVAIALGTGEQDRVGAIEQAITKYKLKYEGEEVIENAVMASDGFFPFYDSIKIAAEAGINAIIAPSGSIKDYEVIEYANNNNVAIYYAPERCFSHH